MRNRIASALLAGTAAVAAVAAPTAAVAATRHPVITKVYATPMAIGLTGHQKFTLRVTATDPKGIRSIHVLAWPLAPNGLRPTQALTAASGWATFRSRTATSETVGVDYTYNDALRMEGDDRAGGSGLAVLVTANDGSTTYVADAGTYWFRFADQLPAHPNATAVRKGARVTLHGRLTFADWDLNKWRANAGQRVSLQYRRAGSSAWVTESTGHTTTDGSVSVSAHDRATGSWRLVYGGSYLYAPTTSAPVRISVR